MDAIGRAPHAGCMPTILSRFRSRHHEAARISSLLTHIDRLLHAARATQRSLRRDAETEMRLRRPGPPARRLDAFCFQLFGLHAPPERQRAVDRRWPRIEMRILAFRFSRQLTLRLMLTPGAPLSMLADFTRARCFLRYAI